jgi:hypothetical protein
MTSSRAERKLPRAGNGRVSAAGFPASSPDDWSIVALSTFIHATRDSGYKATSHAVAELVDNAIQAAAKRVAITITQAPSDDRYPMEIRVIDNGVGMSRANLRPQRRKRSHRESAQGRKRQIDAPVASSSRLHRFRPSAVERLPALR